MLNNTQCQGLVKSPCQIGGMLVRMQFKIGMFCRYACVCMFTCMSSCIGRHTCSCVWRLQVDLGCSLPYWLRQSLFQLSPELSDMASLGGQLAPGSHVCKCWNSKRNAMPTGRLHGCCGSQYLSKPRISFSPSNL